MKSKESTFFKGSHRDINYLINRFESFSHSGADYAWAHYIIINLDKQIKEQFCQKPIDNGTYVLL